MKRIVKDRKFLIGLAASLVLAMAVGSFAIGEAQTPVTPQAAEPQVAATNDEETGAFKVEGGSYGTDADYHFGGASGTDGVLYIHPQNSETEITVSNEEKTTDRIEVTKAATIILAGVDIDRSDVIPTTNVLGAALTIPEDAAFDVNILLEDNTQNILKGSQGASGIYGPSPGIFKNDGAGTLTIGVKEDTKGTGQLEAVAGDDNAAGGAAGIGGIYGVMDVKNITITGGIITARGSSNGAGIGAAAAGNAENIKITGGKVYAYGGRIEGKDGGVGIGSGTAGDATNITISGGEVEAYGYFAPGIGGQSVDGINISGGKVTAIAEDSRNGSAGIGTSGSGEAKNINITGGVIIATGGDSGPGIGSAFTKSFDQNITLDGDAVVLATAGSNSTVDPIAPDKDFTFTRGIAFTRKGTGDYYGEMCGDVTVTESVEISTNFTVKNNSKLTIASENSLGNEINFSIANGKTLKIDSGSELINEGRISIPESSLNCSDGGQIKTLLKYDPQGGSFDDLTDSYQLYKDSSGAGKSYTNLPTEVTNAIFNGWKRNADGTGAKLSESTVDLNLHQAYADMDYAVTFDSQGGSDVAGTTSKYNVKLTKPASDPTKKGYDFDGWYKEEGCTNKWDFEKDTVKCDTTLYAKWTPKEKHQIVTNQPEDGSIELDKDEAKEGDEVSFTLTPDEGYELKEGSVKVTDEDGNEIQVTEKDGKYTFEMPDSEVTISAEFEQIPTPTPPGPEPTPEPTPDPSVDPDGGSGASSKTSDPFMGGIALALLGVATTGAILTRKIR